MICAVCDAGPLTHLWQIRLWTAFKAFTVVYVPEQVAEEVQKHVEFEQFKNQGISVLNIRAVSSAQIESFKTTIPPSFNLHLADCATCVLAQDICPDFVLTDDLSLRRVLEMHSHPVMGSVGLVMYAYKIGLLNQETLQHTIDELFVHSTLYLSPQFKTYVRKLIAVQLPE